MRDPEGRPTVVAIYCPLWHNYDHLSSWKDEGWCEWVLRKARNRRQVQFAPCGPITTEPMISP